MPYIPPDHRSIMTPKVGPIESPGELNFAITGLIKAYIEENGTSYSVFNDIMGALEGAKLEFYRRVVAPYEDSKIKENGDVY